MNKLCLLGAAALIATAFLPDVASAQRGGGGGRHDRCRELGSRPRARGLARRDARQGETPAVSTTAP